MRIIAMDNETLCEPKLQVAPQSVLEKFSLEIFWLDKYVLHYAQNIEIPFKVVHWWMFGEGEVSLAEVEMEMPLLPSEQIKMLEKVKKGLITNIFSYQWTHLTLPL